MKESLATGLTTTARIDIDAGLEVSVHFYPVVAGVPRDDLAPGCSMALLQLHDDGGGSVDPGQLGELLEWLLQDIVAAAAHVELHSACERFAGGERPLLLSDTSGQLLEMPAGLAGDY